MCVDGGYLKITAAVKLKGQSSKFKMIQCIK